MKKTTFRLPAERGVDIFSSHIGALFFYILEFLADPSKLEALAETIAGGLWGFDFEKQVKLIKLIKSEKYKRNRKRNTRNFGHETRDA